MHYLFPTDFKQVEISNYFQKIDYCKQNEYFI